MFLSPLITIPLAGMIAIFLFSSPSSATDKADEKNYTFAKKIALFTSLTNLIISLIVWILFNNSSKYFQFIQEHYTVGYYDFYLGIDGLSIYFVLLTTIIIPLSILSNWKSIEKKGIYFLCIMLLLESLLLLIYMVLDLLMFYIFFESILAPLFLLIGLFGSIEKQRASFYFFLYTFLGSLFMLLSIITISYLSGCTDINIVSRNGFVYITQLLIFLGIFIAFAVKTPVIYLNGWLLKAHVESPLSGSIILAAIVLKLSLYGIFRLILIISPKAYLVSTYIIFTIGVITIIYASLSTLRTIDIKELIAYSSVSHAAVYFIGVFSNVIHGIVGAICLGLAHGFVSSGLFTIAGGVLYDRSGTRLISSYRGLVQAMPILSILFFILCLGNCGAPLTLNFIGEFMSLYGVFERLPLAGVFASTSIVFSAAFTIFMFNRIIFGGSLLKENWTEYLADLNLREYSILLILVIFTVALGIYPSIVTDGLNYVSSALLYSFSIETLNEDSILLVSSVLLKKKKNIKRIKRKEIKLVTTYLYIYTLIIIITTSFPILLLDYDAYFFIIFIDIIIFSTCSLYFYIWFTRLTKTKKRILWDKFKDRNKSYVQYLINFIAIFFLQYCIYHINYVDPFSLFFNIIITLGLIYIITFLIYGKLFIPTTHFNIWSFYEKYKPSRIKKNLPILIPLVRKLFIIGLLLYIMRLLFLPNINDIFTYFIVILSTSPYIYFFIFFIKNLIKNYNVCSIYQIILISLNDTCEMYNPSKIILGVLSVVLINIVKCYFIEACFIVYNNGLKIKIPLLQYNIIDKKNIISFFITNKQNFTRLNITRINFFILFKSLFNVSIKIYILDVHFNNIAKGGFNFNTPPRVSSPVFNTSDIPSRPNTPDRLSLLSTYNTNSSMLSEQQEDTSLRYIYSTYQSMDPSFTKFNEVQIQEKVEEIRNNISEQYPHDVQWVNYNMAWLSHILRHHEYRDTIAGYDAFNILVHLALGRTLSNTFSNFGILAYETQEAKKVLSLIPNLPFFLDKLIDNMPAENRSVLIAKYLWLIEETELIKPTLTSEERRYFTYKPNGEHVASSWAVGNLSAQERTSFIDALRNGGQLNFTIEFNPSYPDNLNKDTDMLYSNLYYTKYSYSGRDARISYWYEIRDPYLAWYNKFSPSDRRNGVIAYHLSKIAEDRLNCGFRSFHNIMDGRLVTWCADAINHGIQKRGLSVTITNHPAIVISQETITILRNWLA